MKIYNSMVSHQDPPPISDMDKDYFGFPPTMWSQILAKAQDRKAKDYKEKLGELISLYWKPVFRYIKIAWKMDDDAAADLTQEFFTVFLEKDYVQNVSREKGRFRTYLKVALKHFLINFKGKKDALKRGGGDRKLSLDRINLDRLDAIRVDDSLNLFDREWARTVLQRCIGRMKKTLTGQKKEKYFLVFEQYHFNNNPDNKITHEKIANKLGIKATDVKNYLTFTRNLLRRMIESEIKEYIVDPAEVEDELKFLMSVKL